MLTLFAQASDSLYRSLELPEVSINWLAVLAATAAAMAIGALWYGPLFGKQWMKLVKLTKKDVNDNDWRPMLFMLLLAFLQAIILKHFIIYTAYFYPGMSQLSAGLFTGFWLFAGVALPLIISNNMFAKRPLNLIYIEAGNSLITLLSMGIILAYWV